MAKRKIDDSDSTARKRTSKSKQSSKLTAARVRRIAKSVLLKSAETKSYVAEYTTNVSDNAAAAINLNFALAVGDGNENRIGTKIHITNIRVRGLVYSNNATTTTKIARVLLIKTSEALTNTTNTAITNSLVFRTGTTGVVSNAHVDMKKVTLLHDERMEMTPTYGAVSPQTMLMPYDFNIVLNKPEVYKSDAAGYLKNGNYYLILVAYDGSTGACIGFNNAVSINFKDE